MDFPIVFPWGSTRILQVSERYIDWTAIKRNIDLYGQKQDQIKDSPYSLSFPDGIERDIQTIH
jgi:hypothetical protein